MQSNFIKEAYKSGNIKKYNEVKDSDPNLLENECPSFYIGEKLIEYPTYEIGDIVYVKNYKHESGANGQNHLFVIVDEENYAVSINYFCMILSSKIEKLRYKQNVLLKKDGINKLKKDSIVKTDYIYILSKSDINMFVGKVSKEKVEEFKQLYLNGVKDE